MSVQHISLVVADPNHCSHLISTQLYSAYKEVAKDDALALETRFQMQKLDQYQNAVSQVIGFITSKIHWSALTTHQGSEDRSKSVKKMFSLLAWQLARFCDGTKKVKRKKCPRLAINGAGPYVTLSFNNVEG